MLWTHPYRIVRGGLRWTIWSSWGKSYKPVTLVLMFMALMFWKEFSIDVWQWQCLSHFSLLRLFQHVLPLHTQPPPFPPDLLPHLPDVREVWEEPGGVCVPQGPLFLLNCRETPHVLKNTSTHTHTLHAENTLAALLHIFLKCLTLFLQWVFKHLSQAIFAWILCN